MNKNLFTLIALLLSTTCFIAQEKSKLKNIQEETITTTTVTKGLTEETTVKETKKVEKQIIEIKDTGVENQNEVYKTKKENDVHSTSSEIIKNKENEAALEEIRRKQQEEIEASKKAQLKKYEEERKAMEANRPEKYQNKAKDSIH